MKKVVLITNVDSYVGYSLAYEFLVQDQKDMKYRLLCHERQLTSDLEAMGGEVYELSTYHDAIQLKQLFQDVFYVILIPENTSHCYEEGRCIIEAAKEYKVDYVSMTSFVGIEKLKNKEFKYLYDYKRLEEQIQKSFDKSSYCFFRFTLLHQFFYYFGPMIENQNKIQLVIQDKVTTVDLLNVIEAIVYLSTNENCQKNQTVFEFTPTFVMTTEDMIRSASKGLGIKNLTYERVDATILCHYLNKIHEDDRFKERHDRLFPLGQYLNHHFVQLIIEYQQLLNQLKELNITKDLQNAIKKHPISMEAFFNQNKHRFQDLK